MTIVFQALVGLTLLLGLVSLFLSGKNWHWSQIVLLMFVLFMGVGVFYFTAKVLNKRKQVMSPINRLERDLENALKKNDLLLNGDGQRKGVRELDHELTILLRERGSAWREVMPSGQANAKGQVAVEITDPVPHGLERGAIIYAFESGVPNPADPKQGAQYLGEFRVVDVAETGATLESTHLLFLNPDSLARLQQSQGPWSLYETMPLDRHTLFDPLSEEELGALMPEESLTEYVRHGGEATADDIQRGDAIGLDANDQRVGPDMIDEAVKKLYDRPLRDYSYLFGQMAVRRTTNIAQLIATQEDNTRLETALKSAEKLTEFREEEKEVLAKNLEGMQQDRAAIEAHRDKVQTQLNNALAHIESLIAQNLEYARRYTALQRERTLRINSIAPAPGGNFTSP